MPSFRRHYTSFTTVANLEVRRRGEKTRCEAIAVGSKEFVDATAERLGIQGKGRQVIVENGGYKLQEPGTPYNNDFDAENGVLSNENTYYLERI